MKGGKKKKKENGEKKEEMISEKKKEIKYNKNFFISHFTNFDKLDDTKNIFSINEKDNEIIKIFKKLINNINRENCYEKALIMGNIYSTFDENTSNNIFMKTSKLMRKNNFNEFHLYSKIPKYRLEKDKIDVKTISPYYGIIMIEILDFFHNVKILDNNKNFNNLIYYKPDKSQIK